MKTVSKLSVGILLITFLFVCFIFYSWLTVGCNTDFEYEKSKVIDHLNKKGLEPEFLKIDNEKTTECESSFIYKTEDEHIHFMVIGGGKVTWWDYNKRGK